MSAFVLTLDPTRPAEAFIRRAAEALAQGGLVVFPTETLYGIAADHANPAALERLAALKGRRPDKPFPLILARAEEVQAIAAEVPPRARELMARHWPGPLTLVLPARPGLHPCLTLAGGVAARLSPHPVAAGLARALGRAITATSANPAGAPAPVSAQALDPAIAGGVDLILDAGPTAGGPPSTLVDARQDPPRVLRVGAVIP
ncbi:MAG: threonylcarbamoyl-AMP synthase [Desulfarculus sp.]|nr:MAG: threonylcarbamoyl-AMP synthase [Desulfarculus sp.]